MILRYNQYRDYRDKQIIFICWAVLHIKISKMKYNIQYQLHSN